MTDSTPIMIPKFVKIASPEKTEILRLYNRLQQSSTERLDSQNWPQLGSGIASFSTVILYLASAQSKAFSHRSNANDF